MHVLLHDQQLIPRLRALKHFFFLSQSSFLTHFLDISHVELRKSVRSVSLPKLQSLLDISLSLDTGGYHHTLGAGEWYKDEVKVTMASSGLYDWLLKIVSVNGVIGGDEGDHALGADTGHDDKKDKDDKDKKQLLGEI